MTSTHDSRSVSFEAVVDTDGVAKASRHTLLAQLATQVSRLAVSVVLARLLTPSDFGVVAAAMVVMVVAGSSRTWGRQPWSSSATSSTTPGELALLRQSPPRRWSLRGHGRPAGPLADVLGRHRPLQPSGSLAASPSSGPWATCITPCCGEPCSSAGSPPSPSRTRSSTAWWGSRSPLPAPASGLLVAGTVAGVAVSTATLGGTSRGDPRPRSASDDSEGGTLQHPVLLRRALSRWGSPSWTR